MFTHPDGTWNVLALLLAVPVAAMLGLVSRARTTQRHERGALLQVRTGRWRRCALLHGCGTAAVRQGRPDGTRLSIAGVALGTQEEVKHFKLLGTTGTGKSTAIRQLLLQALERGDRAVIADPDAGYRERLGNRYRGDVIVNPFEPGSARWDPFAEIRNPYDIEHLAMGLIPNTEDAAGREWRGYARTFLVAVTRRCHRNGRCDTHELWRLLLLASSEQLQAVVAGTPAQPFLEPENARMFGSIRSVAAAAMAALEPIRAQRGAPFSVRNWVRSGRGVLFLPYRAGQIAALQSIIAAWVRLAIFEAMEGPEADGRLWFIIDELDALGRIDGLKDALARLRKFGGRCVLGFQSLAQVSSTYGAGEAQTIIENCGNTLILRCSSGERGGTSQFASRLIGDREVVRRQTSRGRDYQGLGGGRGQRRSRTVSEQQVTEPAVLPAQIEQLPDRCGYLKTAASPAWRKVMLPVDRSRQC